MTYTGIESVTLSEATSSFLSRQPIGLWVDGEWAASRSGEQFQSYNPGTGKALASISLAGEADVDTAVAAARAAFDSGPWGNLSSADRGNLLWKLADLVERDAQILGELDTLDNGKPIRAAIYGDIPQAVKYFRYYAGWASKLEGSTIPVSHPNQLVYTMREPVGVAGLIIPWNFPLLMCSWKLAPALAAGNTVILKPAEETPLSALYLAELTKEAGFPDGVVNVLTGPGLPTGAAMTAHLGVDKIAFTGSTEVGRIVMKAAADSNLKRVSLELGGKSPNVIFADADLKQAIRGANWASFSTSGQECVAGSRLFVERPVYDEVLEGLASMADYVRVGNGFAPKVHVGPIISDTQLNRITGFIEDGKAEGAQIVTGGGLVEGAGDGYFLRPTVFAHENDSLSMVKEEIFGPVVGVTPFDDWDELISRANDTSYGLASGVWTQDIGKAHRFAQSVRAGTVWINQYGMFDPAAPFGGYKQSGFGREMGKDALELYTQVKTVWVAL